jgi:hypothetical protein
MQGGPVRDWVFAWIDPSAKPHDFASDNLEDWASEPDRKGVRPLGHHLADLDTAVAVRVRRGHRLITDGPFVETKEGPGASPAPDREERTMRQVVPATGRELPRHRTRPLAGGSVGATRPPGRVATTPRGSAKTPCPRLEAARGPG